MNGDWAVRVLVGAMLAVATPIMGIAEVSGQVDKNDIFENM